MSLEFHPPSSEADAAYRPVLMNILALFFLILSCLCPLLATVIFIAPDSAVNLLPPRTAVPAYSGPTPTSTSVYDFPPTWTPTVSPKPSSTTTPRPTMTPETLMPTITSISATQTEDAGLFPFIQEGASPEYTTSPKGCARIYIGGYVYDTTRSPINNLSVHLVGTLGSQTIDLERVSGANTEYKDGGFEFELESAPVLSIQKITIELLDANRTPISDKIVFNTYEGCDKSLILINFIQKAS